MGIVSLVRRGIDLYRHNSWPREKIMEYCQARFRDIVAYAYAKSPFYRELYRSCGIGERDLARVDPADLPVIDKEIVRDNFQKIAVNPPGEAVLRKYLEKGNLVPMMGRRILVHSSGSTGRPANFLYSEAAITEVESNFIRLSVGGRNAIAFSDFPIRTLYVASVGRGYASVCLAFRGIKKYHSKSLVLNVQEPIGSWPERIQKFMPSYIAGYPSCVTLIADMQVRGEIYIKPKKIITGGEPLTAETKKYYSEVFGADVIDYYGCSESLFIGAGSTWYEGIYLYDDMNYVEVDSSGRLIISPLYNRAFPLIRYRLSDVVLGFNREYPGPLPFTHIEKILGRSEEMMWFKNAQGNWDFLHPLFIDDLQVPGIKEYQFVQLDERSLLIKVVLEPGVSEENVLEVARTQVCSFLEKKRLSNVSFDVRVVDALEKNGVTGKSKLVCKMGAIGPG